MKQKKNYGITYRSFWIYKSIVSNILNCCFLFGSKKLVSAMILASNSTDVWSILVNSQSSKGFQVKLIYSFALSSRKRSRNYYESSWCFLVALKSFSSLSSPSYNSFSNSCIVMAKPLLDNSRLINSASSVWLTKWVAPAIPLIYVLFCLWTWSKDILENSVLVIQVLYKEVQKNYAFCPE